jgi:hypothetical protein
MDDNMLKECELVKLFCQIDDFITELEQKEHQNLLGSETKHKRGPACRLSASEIMSILIIFQMIGYRNFKTFYEGFLLRYWSEYFPDLPSYTRFVELIPRAIMPLILFTSLNSGKRSGIYYIDSSCLPTCHIKRSKRHHTFKDVAKYGKTSVGWFFGLKLHLIINDIGELIAFKITQGNRSDIKTAQPMLAKLKGLAFGDKGYIGKKVFDVLFENGLKLITRKRKNMKNNMPLSSYEKQLLDQRGLIETVFGCLKHKFHVWHTRHRSVTNAMTHLMAALAAYTIEPLKFTAIKRLNSDANLLEMSK